MRRKLKSKLKMPARHTAITTEFIRLSAFLKFCGLCDTGSAANDLIRGGTVLVNGHPCSERGKKLVRGDTVFANGALYLLTDNSDHSNP